MSRASDLLNEESRDMRSKDADGMTYVAVEIKNKKVVNTSATLSYADALEVANFVVKKFPDTVVSIEDRDGKVKKVVK